MKVRIMKLGYGAKEVDVAAGSTVEEIVENSGLAEVGYSVTLNGSGAMLSAQPGEGDVIALVPKVEGGMVA
jgi:sulfur carrier protein ThiS